MAQRNPRDESFDLTQIGVFAEVFADAMAAPYFFWLGDGRRLPGDEPITLPLEALTEESLEIRINIATALRCMSVERLLEIAATLKDNDPRIDVIAVALDR